MRFSSENYVQAGVINYSLSSDIATTVPSIESAT